MKLSLFALSLLLAVLLTQGCSESRHHKGNTPASSSSVSSQGSSASMRSSSSSQSSASSESNISVDPTIKSVKLTIPAQELPEHNETTLSVTVTSIDETNTTPKTGIVWHIGDTNIVEVNGTRLFARNEGHTTIQAEVRGVLSSARSIAVYKVIHGHRLPPEPDPKINNATLLGIDSNHNGVRDDVERAIYFRYKRPIEQAYMMQSAKWYPQTLENPVAAAESKELEKENWNRASCDNFLLINGIETQNTVAFMENAYFNTKDRMRAYIKFNEASSGGVFHIPLLRDADEANCDFNVTKMLKMEK